MFGSVDIDITDEVEISAGFASFNIAISPAVIETGFREELDTCDITAIGGDSDGPLSPIANPPEGFSFDPISAGEVITITSGVGSYAEISKQSEFGFTFYDLAENVTLSTPVPSDLTVDISQ